MRADCLDHPACCWGLGLEGEAFWEGCLPGVERGRLGGWHHLTSPIPFSIWEKEASDQGMGATHACTCCPGGDACLPFLGLEQHLPACCTVLHCLHLPTCPCCCPGGLPATQGGTPQTGCLSATTCHLPCLHGRNISAAANCFSARTGTSATIGDGAHVLPATTMPPLWRLGLLNFCMGGVQTGWLGDILTLLAPGWEEEEWAGRSRAWELPATMLCWGCYHLPATGSCMHPMPGACLPATCPSILGISLLCHACHLMPGRPGNILCLHTSDLPPFVLSPSTILLPPPFWRRGGEVTFWRTPFWGDKMTTYTTFTWSDHSLPPWEADF